MRAVPCTRCTQQHLIQNGMTNLMRPLCSRNPLSHSCQCHCQWQAVPKQKGPQVCSDATRQQTHPHWLLCTQQIVEAAESKLSPMGTLSFLLKYARAYLRASDCTFNVKAQRAHQQIPDTHRSLLGLTGSELIAGRYALARCTVILVCSSLSRRCRGSTIHLPRAAMQCVCDTLISPAGWSSSCMRAMLVRYLASEVSCLTATQSGTGTLPSGSTAAKRSAA